MYNCVLQISVQINLKLFKFFLFYSHIIFILNSDDQQACSAYMHLLSICLFNHLSVNLCICLWNTNHLSACPQICMSWSVFCATRKQSQTFIPLRPENNTWWHRNVLHAQKKNSVFTAHYSTWRRNNNQSVWLALQCFGSFGCCWLARLNDLHRVVVSYRPALKALAGHAATQAGNGFRNSGRHAVWWHWRTRLIKYSILTHVWMSTLYLIL